MKELIERLVTNWKSTVIAVVIFGASAMVYKKEMTTEQWALVMGTVATLYGLFKKDDDINTKKTA